MAAGRPLAKPGPFPFRRTHRPSGTTAGVGAEVIGVPGANGRGGPPITIPAGSFSTNLGLHGPEINIRAITAITTKAAIIGQLILLISTSPPLNRHSNRPRRARLLPLHPLRINRRCGNQSALGILRTWCVNQCRPARIFGWRGVVVSGTAREKPARILSSLANQSALRQPTGAGKF